MKISRVERLTILGLAAALVAFSVFCIFWTPCDQLKLLRPIPAGAVLITSHRNLGSRLEHMATNVFLKAIFDANETALKNLRNNRYAARILASRLIIMAYVPNFNYPSNPAFVISAWVGGWSPVFRWTLWVHPPKDMASLGEYNGHRLWAYKKPVSFFGVVNYFSFAIEEGIFIGCLSPDRNGVVGLLRNYDGGKDSILNVQQCRFEEKASAPDQVWLRVDLPNAPQNKTFFAVGSVDSLENDYLAATIRFEPDIQLNNFSGLNQNLAEIGKMSACLPAIVALFPSELAADGIDGLTRPGGLISPAWARAVKPILSPLPGPNNICSLMVFAGDYGGKFGKEPLRITVPTIMLAVSGARQVQTQAAVLELLDLINAKHRLGLILNSTLPPAGQYPVFAIESTSNAFLNSWPVEDQPAFAFYNDWFLLASNGAGLRTLLLKFQSQTVSAGDGGNHWLKQADNRRKGAFIWVDPGEGGKALRFALTASIIMLDADSRNPSKQNTIKIFKAARSWLEGISSLKNCAAWMESENGKTVVRLEIGRKN